MAREKEKSYRVMAFKIILKDELADMFESEMQLRDRKKLPMARFIITQYFRERTIRDELDGPISHQNGKGAVPHFGDAPSPRKSAILRKLPQ